MNRRTVLLVSAALVAVLGVALVFLYVRGADDRAAEQYDTAKVLRAVVGIEPGESIDDAAAAGKLALQPVSKGDRLPGAQTSIEELSGKVATTRIYPGEQIVAEKFGNSVEVAPSALQIPEKRMAVSVNLTDPARVAGFLNPGAKVAVFLNGQDRVTGAGYTRLLLPEVTVLGVGSTSTTTTTTTTTSDGEQTTEELPKTLLTLALTQAEAEKVLYGASNGELALGLLTEKSTVKPGPGVTAGNVFG